MKRLIYIPVIVIAMVFCIRLVHEPDLWWQLRTGEYILENKTVPDKDVFSYTYEGQSWLNVKWGFEVIQATVVKLFGAEFLFLPQLFANLLLVIFLLLILRKLPQPINLSRGVKAFGILLFLAGMSYRMNGRPELVTYTFTAIFLFILLSASYENKRWLLALVPAQLLWTNLHEAYGVGMVMTGVFLAAAGFNFLTKKVKGSDAKKELVYSSLIIVGSWLVTAIHPGGVQMIWHPYEIFTQLSENQFTQEIYSAANADYWQMPAFAGLAMGILALLHLYRSGKPGKKFQIKALLSVYPLFYVLLFLAFFYLSLKSYRNLPFLLIIATPLATAQLAEWVGTLRAKTMNAAVIAACIILYLTVVTNVFYERFLPAEVYGVGINPKKNAVGSARFIKSHNLQDKKAFTDYLISSYLLWDLQPGFKTFVDLRDLDVFEADDIELSIILCNQPDRKIKGGKTIWQAIDERIGFDYVTITNNEQFMPLQRYLVSNTDFTLVYADELSAVFAPIEGNPTIEALVNNEEFRIFNPLPRFEQSATASVVSRLFWPFYKPPRYDANRFATAKQIYFQSIGMNPK
jgi:hypothetical protein